MKQVFKKISWKIVIWLVILVVLLIGISLGIQRVKASFQDRMQVEEEINTASVEIRDIQNVLSSSGTISPLNTYEVTTLVEGEVIMADFEEGDSVSEGQVLYQVATENLDSSIDSAQTAVNRAEKNLTKAQRNYEEAVVKYNDAKLDYEEAKEKYGNPHITSEETGVIKTLYIEEGTMIQAGTQIAQIYDNSMMLLTLPFSATEVDQDLVGKRAVIMIEATQEDLSGTVTKVSNIDEVLSGNRLVNQVTIQVKNPGGINSTTSATAKIGNHYSSGEGTFQVLTDTVLKAEMSGEIDKILVSEGSKVMKGDVIYTLSEQSIENQLEAYKNKLENAENAVENAKDSVDSAQEAIEDSQTKLQDVIDNRTDYSIKAPISGRIVSKEALVGDTIKSNSMNSTLCIIYDLSAVTFEMSVDELDVNKVKVGQEVAVVADAFEEVTYEGVVTNVSLISNTSQGVTQYPVTVKITEAGDLLPGMNVTGEIIIEKVQQAIAIPSDALRRGDVVYVEDVSVTEADGDIPAGFKEVEVETGITDGDYVEILRGLNGDERVYVQRVSVEIPGLPGMGFGQQGDAFDDGNRRGPMTGRGDSMRNNGGLSSDSQ